MTARPAFRMLVACSLMVAFTGCVAEGSRTDTLVVQPAAKAPAAPRANTPAPAPTRTDTVIPGSGTINLRNPNFANVNVEVRVGPNADCNQNAVFGARQLQRGASWAISSNQDVCWRRDANPDAPNGTWTAWNRQAITAGSSHDATL